MATVSRSDFVFELKTGNLPSALVSTAVVYDSKKDCKVSALPGCRLSFIGYKLTSNSKVDEIQPANFVVQVPQVGTDLLATTGAIQWLHDLAADWQDSVIVANANKESAVNPLDWSAMISDYYDNSRSVGGLTAKVLKDWIAEVWEPAFISRQIQLNETAVADGRKVKTDSEIEALARGYKNYMTQLLAKQVLLGKVYIKSVGQSLERLAEVSLLSAEMPEFNFFLDKIKICLATDEEMIADAV